MTRPIINFSFGRSRQKASGFSKSQQLAKKRSLEILELYRQRPCRLRPAFLGSCNGILLFRSFFPHQDKVPPESGGILKIPIPQKSCERNFGIWRIIGLRSSTSPDIVGRVADPTWSIRRIDLHVLRPYFLHLTSRLFCCGISSDQSSLTCGSRRHYVCVSRTDRACSQQLITTS